MPKKWRKMGGRNYMFDGAYLRKSDANVDKKKWVERGYYVRLVPGTKSHPWYLYRRPIH